MITYVGGAQEERLIGSKAPWVVIVSTFVGLCDFFRQCLLFLSASLCICDMFMWSLSIVHSCFPDPERSGGGFFKARRKGSICRRVGRLRERISGHGAYPARATLALLLLLVFRFASFASTETFDAASLTQHLCHPMIYFLGRLPYFRWSWRDPPAVTR